MSKKEEITLKDMLLMSSKINEQIDESMNKEFIKFLKDKNCYEQFMTNVENSLKRQGHTDINKAKIISFVSGFDIFRKISGPFIWNSSPEGADFWYNIHFRYMEQIK